MKETQTLRTQYKVSDFVAWQRERSLELNPEFQRRAVWGAKAKSFLIDTIVRGMPVPIIFLRDKQADIKTLVSIKDVVDGQQRIRTILSFIDPILLRDYDPDRDAFKIDKAHMPEHAGKTFQDLPAELKQRILDYQFSVHVFSADTADSDILQIFARMNSTGYKLNAQELRNAEFYGEFKTTAYELASEQLERWRKWKLFSPDSIARMHEVELTSELMLLIMNGVLAKRKITIDNYYRFFDDSFLDEAEVSRRFRRTMDQIDRLFDDAVLQDSFRNRNMFFALFALVYGQMFEIRETSSLPDRTPLKKALAKKLDTRLAEVAAGGARSIQDQSAPVEVLKVTRGAVTDAGSRRTLIGHLAGDLDNPCPHPR